MLRYYFVLLFTLEIKLITTYGSAAAEIKGAFLVQVFFL